MPDPQLDVRIEEAVAAFLYELSKRESPAYIITTTPGPIVEGRLLPPTRTLLPKVVSKPEGPTLDDLQATLYTLAVAAAEGKPLPPDWLDLLPPEIYIKVKGGFSPIKVSARDYSDFGYRLWGVPDVPNSGLIGAWRVEEGLAPSQPKNIDALGQLLSYLVNRHGLPPEALQASDTWQAFARVVSMTERPTDFSEEDVVEAAVDFLRLSDDGTGLEVFGPLANPDFSSILGGGLATGVAFRQDLFAQALKEYQEERAEAEALLEPPAWAARRKSIETLATILMGRTPTTPEMNWILSGEGATLEQTPLVGTPTERLARVFSLRGEERVAYSKLEFIEEIREMAYERTNLPPAVRKVFLDLYQSGEEINRLWNQYVVRQTEAFRTTMQELDFLTLSGEEFTDEGYLTLQRLSATGPFVTPQEFLSDEAVTARLRVVDEPVNYLVTQMWEEMSPGEKLVAVQGLPADTLAQFYKRNTGGFNPQEILEGRARLEAAAKSVAELTKDKDFSVTSAEVAQGFAELSRKSDELAYLTTSKIRMADAAAGLTSLRKEYGESATMWLRVFYGIDPKTATPEQEKEILETLAGRLPNLMTTNPEGFTYPVTSPQVLGRARREMASFEAVIQAKLGEVLAAVEIPKSEQAFARGVFEKEGRDILLSAFGTTPPGVGSRLDQFSKWLSELDLGYIYPALRKPLPKRQVPAVLPSFLAMPAALPRR